MKEGNPALSNERNPQGILYSEEGSYDVSLTVSDGTNEQTIIKEDYISVTQDFVMEDVTVTTCTGVFYDNGGADNEYGDNENFTMTFLPGEENGKIKIQFTAFDIEYDNGCDYDWLKIYDGADISAPVIGVYCGTDSPGIKIATNDDGALTFQFHSDYSVTGQGWVASISCVTEVLAPVAEFVADANWIWEGDVVSFSDQSTNDPEVWEWVFEGGYPSASDFPDSGGSLLQCRCF